MIGAGDALRYLADGKRHQSRPIAKAAGWKPRTAGQRLCALERQGFVERYGDESRYDWKLTEKGFRFVGRSFLNEDP